MGTISAFAYRHRETNYSNINLLNNGKEIKWSEIYGNNFYCGKIVHGHTVIEYGALGRVELYLYIVNYSKIIQEGHCLRMNQEVYCSPNLQVLTYFGSIIKKCVEFHFVILENLLA